MRDFLKIFWPCFFATFFAMWVVLGIVAELYLHDAK
jgi:hypothetical protein